MTFLTLSRRSFLLTVVLALGGLFYVGLVRDNLLTTRQLLNHDVRNNIIINNNNNNNNNQNNNSNKNNDNNSAIRFAKSKKVVVNVTKSRRYLHTLKRVGADLIPHRLKIETGEVKPVDLMKAGPFDFLPNYRNPCWKGNTSIFPYIKCLPYFYLIGAPKAGTTDLYSRIIQHQSVSYVTPKEPHWLPRSHFYGKRPKPELDDYMTILSNGIKDVYRIKDREGWHPKILVDASASTMWDNDYWSLLPEFDNLTEPLYTNPDYIHHLNPNTKIIAILRNPIDRLYSDYLFFGNSKKDPGDFHQGAIAAIDYLNGCLEERTLRSCVYHRPPKTKTSAQLRIRIGLYCLHLEEWLRVFPRKQILVLKLEQHSKNMTSSLGNIFNFLELEPLSHERRQNITNMKNRNTRRPADKKVGDMLPETRELLKRFYFPYNKRLVELFGEEFNYNDAD